MKGLLCATPSTEDIKKWWESMKLKGANYVSIGTEDGIYKLYARTHGAKQRLGQKSLGTTDKKIADEANEILLMDTSDTSPEAVIFQYCKHKKNMAKICDDNNENHFRYVEPRKKTARTNKSRLEKHLLPFCRMLHINDVKELYRRDIVGKFLIYLAETVAEAETCRSIVKTTRVFLHWYDMTNTVKLATPEFECTIQDYKRFFAHKIPRDKPFLNDENVRKLITRECDIPELKARILASLVGGLRHNEINGLRWCDLNEKEGCIKVKKAKGGKTRVSQYPKFLRDAFSEIRHTRHKNIMEGDLVFTRLPYSQINTRIKEYIQKVCGVNGKNFGSNCLRRSGCHYVYMTRSDLTDKQLGHRNNVSDTTLSYIQHDDFRDLNKYWDNLYNRMTRPKKPIVSEADLAPYADKIIRIQATTEKNSPIPNVEVRLSSML